MFLVHLADGGAPLQIEADRAVTHEDQVQFTKDGTVVASVERRQLVAWIHRG